MELLRGRELTPEEKAMTAKRFAELYAGYFFFISSEPRLLTGWHPNWGIGADPARLLFSDKDGMNADGTEWKGARGVTPIHGVTRHISNIGPFATLLNGTHASMWNVPIDMLPINAPRSVNVAKRPIEQAPCAKGAITKTPLGAAAAPENKAAWDAFLKRADRAYRYLSGFVMPAETTAGRREREEICRDLRESLLIHKIGHNEIK